MTDNTIPLKQYFIPKTLTQLGLIGVNLLACVSYADTKLEKTGMQALLGKLPILKTLTPFKSPLCDLDIDLSCAVLDKHGKVLEVLWFGNLRNHNQSIRHSGDALRGSHSFEESLVYQEEISIKLSELDESVQHLVFFVSSYQGCDLNLAQKGVIKLMDNEGNTAHKLCVDELDKDTNAIIAWHIQKQGDDFLLTVPIKKVAIGNSTNAQFVADLSRLASKYITG